VACAAGRPTVATPVGGLVEQVRDGENGILAVAGDPLAFADAIVRALDDLDSLAAGAERVATTWDAVARVVETAGLRITEPQVVPLPAQRVETRSEIARS
jgi:glycosyltransferase involved in cell wall biosynthesis